MDFAALLARWSALPVSIRRVTAVAAAAVVVLSIAAGIVTHPQQGSLFATPLHADQLAEVEERLASWNVPFTPVSDNVLVEQRRRSDLLLRLSMAGTPHAHVDGTGDVLDKLGALTPQTVIDAQTRDGLAGDIELGLRGIAGVQDARVIVAPAKQGYFADDPSHEASASVRLSMLPGMQLSQEAIRGVRAFVAASVPGLNARNVTIVDDRGIALGDENASAGSSDLERSLQSALDSTLGIGAAIVRVHVEYDPETVAIKETKREPLPAPPIGDATQSERYDSAGKHYDRSSRQIDRGSRTREISSSSGPGRVARITAAVLVDESRISDLASVRALSAATLGIDPRRGDSLEVQALNFARTQPVRKDGWWLAYGTLVPLLPALALAAGITLAAKFSVPPFAAALRETLRFSNTARTASHVQGLPASRVRASLADEPPHTAAAIISALPAATAAAVLELYPEHERSAIVRRMNRPSSPLIDDPEALIGRA